MTIVIAIDGLAGSGKGTIAKNISSFYNFPHLDSGILYRSVAYLCHLSGQKIFDEKTVLKYAQNLNLDEIDIDKLRTEKIDKISSLDILKLTNKYFSKPFLSISGNKKICLEISKKWRNF